MEKRKKKREGEEAEHFRVPIHSFPGRPAPRRKKNTGKVLGGNGILFKSACSL